MKKKGLQFQLSVGFSCLVLITIAVVLLSANLWIRSQFRQYIMAGQQEFAQALAENVQSQYDESIAGWNLDYLHGFGMYALDDGYIIRLYDAQRRMLWDAENHDMALCHQVMTEIEGRMHQQMPDEHASYVTKHYDLQKNGNTVGFIDVSYYSPYYSHESDFDFLRSLNQIITVTGILALLGAIICGTCYARRMIRPLQETVVATERIASGNYQVAFQKGNSALEIQELQDAVHRMAESLCAHEKREKRLTRDVAHELRTPLANVSSYLEAMTEGVWEPSRERLLACMQELERLKSLIADLEVLHGLEDEHLMLHREYFDLRALCGRVAEIFESVMRQANLTCEIQGTPTMVWADEKRVHQAIVNLLSNAVKYTEPGDCVILQTTSTEKAAFLHVINHGKPIAADEQNRIFDRFYRADSSRSRKTGGAGIGLAIVKAIIAAHGGTISITSDEHATCFTIQLPVGAHPAVHSSQAGGCLRDR